LTVARFYTPSGRCIQKPYDEGSDDYNSDLLERYRHGEMMDADSIPKNDSLLFYTVGGRPVYGGGGIIPDVFVPVDTVGVTDLLVAMNRSGMQARFSLIQADLHRKALQQAHDLPTLNKVLDGLNLEDAYLNYVKNQGLKVDRKQWAISREVVMTQLRAMVGRYSAMDDAAFYPLIAPLDPVIQRAIAQ
jgi:carboxyl-terminal processing protease